MILHSRIGEVGMKESEYFDEQAREKGDNSKPLVIVGDNYAEQIGK